VNDARVYYEGDVFEEAGNDRTLVYDLTVFGIGEHLLGSTATPTPATTSSWCARRRGRRGHGGHGVARSLAAPVRSVTG
jgi:hypothetical protein